MKEGEQVKFSRTFPFMKGDGESPDAEPVQEQVCGDGYKKLEEGSLDVENLISLLSYNLMNCETACTDAVQHGQKCVAFRHSITHEFRCELYRKINPSTQELKSSATVCEHSDRLRFAGESPAADPTVQEPAPAVVPAEPKNKGIKCPLGVCPDNLYCMKLNTTDKDKDRICVDEHTKNTINNKRYNKPNGGNYKMGVTKL